MIILPKGKVPVYFLALTLNSCEGLGSFLICKNADDNSTYFVLLLQRLNGNTHQVIIT